VLVINSENDALIPPDITARIADHVPGAVLETIPTAGHLSNMEAPEAFSELLRSHLERC
jgi:3-oxoadipate enol-lactonase